MLVRSAAFLFGAGVAGFICSVLNAIYLPTKDGLSSWWGMPWITFTVIALIDLAGVWFILRLWDFSGYPRSIWAYLIGGALAGLTFVVLLGFFENDALLLQLSEMASGAFGGIVAALCWFGMKRAFKVKV